jgi:hypothetical membrane protein
MSDSIAKFQELLDQICLPELMALRKKLERDRISMPTHTNLIGAHDQHETMGFDNEKMAGGLIFVGAVQFVFALVISEAIYSGYSVGQQYIADLGNWNLAGNSAAIFNLSAILLGILNTSATYFIHRAFKNRLFTSLLAISSVGVIALGIVAVNISMPVHTILALVTFGFAAASAIMSYKFLRTPLSYISVILGVMTLSAIILLILGRGNSDFYLGLSSFGMERFIVYPILLWLLGFGPYLIGDSSDTLKKSKA